ncbi:conserved hypothetical protein [Ricinus communis]|uniref:Uncharacterized protein n=1 Tax=Ricinus communis TaxID=3988 RepID=B9RG35_RICCO|nr:conserved hypothetical protein [Ricinus communis]
MEEGFQGASWSKLCKENILLQRKLLRIFMNLIFPFLILNYLQSAFVPDKAKCIWKISISLTQDEFVRHFHESSKFKVSSGYSIWYNHLRDQNHISSPQHFRIAVCSQEGGSICRSSES